MFNAIKKYNSAALNWGQLRRT